MNADRDAFEKLNAALSGLMSYGLHPMDTAEASFSLTSGFAVAGLRIVPEKGVFCIYTEVPDLAFQDGGSEQALIINATPNLLTGENRLFCDGPESDSVRLGVCISLEHTDTGELERRILEFLRTFPDDLKRISDYLRGESTAPGGVREVPDVPVFRPGYSPDVSGKPIPVNEILMMESFMMEV